jgi:4-diphosphocytidyl-2-C-methyl-D-erythritol kinase
MCRIGLFDEILLSPNAGRITLICSDSALPLDESNLAVAAAHRFYESLGRFDGLEIRLTKRIPVAAGLGGGSSNAASVLLGLNQLHGFPFSAQRLGAIGTSLGADVPFFIFQSPALASGIGDRLDAFDGIPPLAAVVVSPPFAVSTRMVYQNLNLRLTNSQKQPTKAHFNNAAFTPALHLVNDLEAVTLSWHPELESIKKLLNRQGALGSMMSGSGPSIFGLFSSIDAARRAADALPEDRGWRVSCADLLTGPFSLIKEI